MEIGSVTSTPAQAVPQKQKKVTDYRDMLGRIGNIPDLEQYEGAIERMLSGESAMEDPGSGKPLTEDQIMIRRLKREYQKTNPLTLSQHKAVIQSERNRFIDYWHSIGGSGPPPGYVTLEDGSFVIINSKEEKNEYQRKFDESFIRKVLSVIEERKAQQEAVAGGDKAKVGFDVSV